MLFPLPRAHLKSHTESSSAARWAACVFSLEEAFGTNCAVAPSSQLFGSEQRTLVLHCRNGFPANVNFCVSVETPI